MFWDILKSLLGFKASKATYKRTDKQKKRDFEIGKAAESIVEEMFIKASYSVERAGLEERKDFDRRIEYTKEEWSHPDLKITNTRSGKSILIEVKFRLDPKQKTADAVMNRFLNTPMSNNPNTHLLLVTPMYMRISIQFEGNDGFWRHKYIDPSEFRKFEVRKELIQESLNIVNERLII